MLGSVLRSANRGTSPVSVNMREATPGPTPGSSMSVEPVARTISLSFPPRTWTEFGPTPVLPAIVKQPPVDEGTRVALDGRNRGDYAPLVGGTTEQGPEDLFAGFPECLAICRGVEQAVSRIGQVSVSVTKSQVAFRRRKGFAYVWRPGQYVHSEVPAVLSVALPHEVRCHRFKEVVHPSANVWMHHIELHAASQIDDQVRGWLEEAYANAG